MRDLSKMDNEEQPLTPTQETIRKSIIYRKKVNNKSRPWIVYGIVLLAIVLVGGIVVLKTRPLIDRKVTVPSPTPSPAEEQSQITVGETKISIEIARTAEEHAKGLADRESLRQNAGMLFVFETPEKYGFWMKGMRFPLDIIWIADGKVVGFAEKLPVPDPQTPEVDLPTYLPPQSISAALEVNAGFVRDNKIQIDDPVELSNLEPSI